MNLVEINGIKVSRIGYGGWQAGGLHINNGRSIGWNNVNEPDILSSIKLAIEKGVNIFDTSDAYGPNLLSAKRLGKAFSGVDRSSYYIHGKIGYVHEVGEHTFSFENIEARLNKLLLSLKTSYIDFFSFHHNNFGRKDQYLNEALEAASEFKRIGKVRNIGMRFGHKFTGRKKETIGFQDVNSHFKQKIVIEPDFLCINGSPLRGKIKLDSNETVFVNKPFDQGLFFNTIKSIIVGDNRINKKNFDEKILKDISSKIIENKLSRHQVQKALISRAMGLYDKSVVFCGIRSPQHVENLIESISEKEQCEQTNKTVNEILNYVRNKYV